MLKKSILVACMFISLHAFPQRKFNPNADHENFFQHWGQRLELTLIK